MDQVHDDVGTEKNPTRVQAILSPEKSLGTETTSVNALIQTLSSVVQVKVVSNSGIVYPYHNTLLIQSMMRVMNN